ncbi:membrane protein [Bacteroidia bacterium]|nr:membrane protein [Bacteroidia bacterium]
MSGLSAGKPITVPSNQIADAIERLWKQNVFGGIQIYATEIKGNLIYLTIELDELPHITKIAIEGVKKYDASKLLDELEIKETDVITDNKLGRIRTKAINYYREKGYYNTKIEVIKKQDSVDGNGMNLTFVVNKGKRVKVSAINISGNEAKRDKNVAESYHLIRKTLRKIDGTEDKMFANKRILRNLKNTKQQALWRFWKRSKYVEPNFKDDIKSLVAAYGKEGFRDIRVIRDTVYEVAPNRLKIDIALSEGEPYYFGDITFVGNTRYPDATLSRILNIKKGDRYDEEKFQKNLTFNPTSGDINSLYFDVGYLTFSAMPVETKVENHTVDIEIRIHEGKQARINKVEMEGNTRTNDYVIIRELQVYPGELFSRTDLINSINQLRQLRYFNEESIAPDTRPNIEEGTVDIVYKVEEVGSDQVELSGGWGGNMIVGTLGFSFNNFSIQNLFKRDRWRPLPMGDGQKLTLRGQTNGSQYYSISASYTEPWLGGKKPYALSLSGYTTMQSNGFSKENASRAQIRINGASVGLGQRLRMPDMFFTLYQNINYQKYDIYNYEYLFSVSAGSYQNLSYTISLSRQFLDGAIFPKNGSDVSVSMQATPPYSMFNKIDYTDQSLLDNRRYAWLEFYKWNFKASWFTNPVADLVVNARIRFGAIGQYNHDVGYTPFERYKLGGDGMGSYSYAGHEMISMRGYENERLSPEVGATAFNKLTLELRYPISLNPAATIYGLAFVEAGNSWANSRQINPFKNYRSAGVGVRLFLAAMGMFGLDWGYGFDEVPGFPSANGSQFAFSINQSID